MSDNALDQFMAGDVGRWLDWITTPSFKTIQLALVVYVGLLWLSMVIWVTRDAIQRSESVLFQAFAILLNLVFPILGILLYLIIRPSKTVMERYYEELEHKLILENVEAKTETHVHEAAHHPMRKKTIRKSVSKSNSDQAASIPE